jgi:uncharacterized coiled-coil protein SlyX
MGLKTAVNTTFRIVTFVGQVLVLGQVLIGRPWWRAGQAMGTGAMAWRRYHPPTVDTIRPQAADQHMAQAVSAPAGIGRLAHQLQMLSELSESLTYRLLELEERVAALDRMLQPLLDAHSGASALLAEDAELRLDDTEARLSQLESLLSGYASAASAQAQQGDPAFDPFGERDVVAEDDQLVLDEQAAESGIDDEIQEFPADDFDDDQRLIA